MQRVFDLAFSLIALIMLSPIFLIIMIVLRITGEGEIFFLQERVGKEKKMIKLFKFATMMKNSEKIGTGTVTIKNDPRVLPFGKFLRKSKINELPQLFNVLKGDMSVIGPRPQTIRCFDAFPKSSQDKIIKVRPGLSGIGSIIFRNEERMMSDNNDIEDFYDNSIMPYKGLLEEWYVKRLNLRLYFMLIILTIITIIFSKSNLIWKFYDDLPKPPDVLKSYLAK
tara:strand:- start:7627 stop:8298 length:672 start_codon:yes stop_codon:yes gene_type:complete